MTIAQALRETAQILFPQEWRENRFVALAKALQVLNEASFDFEERPASKRNENKDSARSTEIAQLEEHLKAKSIHVTAAARAIGVNAVTLYSWFQGNSNPRAENLVKIRSFLSKTKTQ